MTEKEIQILAAKFLKGKSTADEEFILHTWYENKGSEDEEIVVITNGEDADKIKNRLYNNIKAEIKENNNKELSFFKWRFLWSSAAAILLCLTTLAVYFYTQNQPNLKEHYTKLLQNDVGPGGNNAILELADGTKVNLDAVHVGEIKNIGEIKAIKSKEGTLSFNLPINQTKTTIQYNTIRTPKGGQYQVELPDGTEVWLNASSSIRFPSSFSKERREVELEGEAYFEVARIENKKRQHIPFIVKSSKQKIEVLGTHFNVSSYSNDETVKTVLVEGAVRVIPNGTLLTRILKPGQGSIVDNKNITIDNVDLESALAWKNGDFVFNNESLSSIMKKLERWYDVEVIYENLSIDHKFSGAVSRSKNISAVLRIMELTGNVKFKIEGRRVIVMT